MYYSIILNLLLITALTTPLFSITPDTVLSYSRSKVLTLTEFPNEEVKLQLYTYYQAKLLNELINNKETQESSLWGLLEKGANTANTEQSNLEWHAVTLKAQNWGNLKDFKWIHATSQIDMVLGFLSSSYTSVCLAGSTTVQNINTILDQIQKQSFHYLQAAPSFAADTPHPETTKLVIQLGRNAYYKKLYIQDESQACAISASATENQAISIQPTETANIDLLAAHIADLEYDENSGTDFNELLENSYTVISNGTGTAAEDRDRAITQTSNTLPSPDHSTEIQQNPVKKSIQTIERAFFSFLPVTHTESTVLYDAQKRHIYLTAIGAMAILDADGQEPNWASEIKSYLDAHSFWSNEEHSETINHLLNHAKNEVMNYLYITPSYFSYGYKQLPEPLNPSKETQNGERLFDSVPRPEIVGRTTPVDIGFMYTKLKEIGDYALQYLKPIEDTMISRMIRQMHTDLGITSHYQKTMKLTITQQIQEGITLTQQIECPDVITYLINNDRETNAPYPIPFELTTEYCQWKDVVHFLDEIARALAAPNLIHQRTHFKHSFDLTNKDFNLANDAFVRENGAQLTQEEADAVMRGIWYKEILNFTTSYHYARTHNLLLNFYTEVLPSSKASNPCLPGKIRQVTDWHEIQIAKQKDYLLSAIRMLFPHTHAYEGIQFNTFLDFITPKLTRNFIIQKIEEYAKKNSVFLGEGLFELEDFQNDGDGNYTLKKSRYQVALDHADFKDELTREAFEDYARAILFNSMVSYFIELNSTYPNGTYRYPTAHQSLIDETSGIQAFHSGHVVFTESNLLHLPTTILNGFGKVNGTDYEYGLLTMYDLQLPHVIHAIKQNPYI